MSDLVALTWLGRGDGTIDEWDDLRQEAAWLHNNRTAAYPLGKPMLADHLEEGLSQFGCSCRGHSSRSYVKPESAGLGGRLRTMPKILPLADNRGNLLGISMRR